MNEAIASRVNDLIAQEPQQDLFAKYDDWHTMILMVGPVDGDESFLLGARFLLALEAFSRYKTFWDQYARLFIVSTDNVDLGNSEYGREIIKAIQYHKLQESVLVVGGLSLEGLKSFYLMADVLLVTGRTVEPISEAMALRVPVVACANNQTIEATAGAGLVLYDGGAHHISDALRTARLLRERLLINGWQSYCDRFAPR